MDIQFIGPLGKVTGSCAWMRDIYQDWNFLVDCGIQQGERTASAWNAGADWAFDPARLQFVVLTHAHLDHSGMIPQLYKSGFRGKIWCTHETAELAKVLLRDAAKLSGGRYEERDLELIQWHTPGGDTNLGNYHPVANDLFIRFFRSGHIIGATSVTILWGPPRSDQRSITFSGDIGPGSEDREALPFLRYPQHPKPATYAVLESTYGDIRRNESEKCSVARRAHLQRLLDQILETGGTLAIPAFAVGRTQDIMFDLHRIVAEFPDRYGAIRFFLDSPTALRVNKITLDALRKTQINRHTGKVRPQWLGKQLFRELGLDKGNPGHHERALAICGMTLDISECSSHDSPYGNSVACRWRPIFSPLGDRDAHINQDSPGPRVVIMTSGTCDGGPAVSWLPTLIQSEKNIVALSGYCSSLTIGGQLLKLINVPLDQRRLQNGQLEWSNADGVILESVPFSKVAAGIDRLSGYSAHGDQTDLVDWLFEIHRGQNKQSLAEVAVFLQHGENNQRDALESALTKRAEEWDLSVDILKPTDPAQWFDLESDSVSPQDTGSLRKEIEYKIRQLERQLIDLEQG